MKFQDILNASRQEYINTKRINCKDGFSMSIQASKLHDCKPEENLGDVYGYTHFEIGGLAEDESLLDEFNQGDAQFGYYYSNVPVEKIEEIINKHNGLVIDNMLMSVNGITLGVFIGE